MKGERPTKATIDLQAIAANYAEARRLGGDRDVIAVVKADGYGHGAVPVARRLVASGCRHLAVVTVAEAAELRAAAIDCGILVLGGVHDAAEAADVLELAVTPVVQHSGHIGLLSQVAREHRAPLPVQVEIDTGMRRMGLAAEDGPALLERIAKERSLELEGVYTHLACADEEDLGPSLNQLRLFSEILSAVQARGTDPGLVHVANSAGLLATTDLAASLPPQVNAVRPGLMLYGAYPAAHLRDRAALAPAMTLRSRVSNVRHVRPGYTVGYGGTFRATRRGRVATLPDRLRGRSPLVAREPRLRPAARQPRPDRRSGLDGSRHHLRGRRSGGDRRSGGPLRGGAPRGGGGGAGRNDLLRAAGRDRGPRAPGGAGVVCFSSVVQRCIAGCVDGTIKPRPQKMIDEPVSPL